MKFNIISKVVGMFEFKRILSYFVFSILMTEVSIQVNFKMYLQKKLFQFLDKNYTTMSC